MTVGRRGDQREKKRGRDKMPPRRAFQLGKDYAKQNEKGHRDDEVDRRLFAPYEKERAYRTDSSSGVQPSQHSKQKARHDPALERATRGPLIELIVGCIWPCLVEPAGPPTLAVSVRCQGCLWFETRGTSEVRWLWVVLGSMAIKSAARRRSTPYLAQCSGYGSPSIVDSKRRLTLVLDRLRYRRALSSKKSASLSRTPADSLLMIRFMTVKESSVVGAGS